MLVSCGAGLEGPLLGLLSPWAEHVPAPRDGAGLCWGDRNGGADKAERSHRRAEAPRRRPRVGRGEATPSTGHDGARFRRTNERDPVGCHSTAETARDGKTM